jgi:hypothetical protein
MCKLGQEGGAPIGRREASAGNTVDESAARRALIWLGQRLEVGEVIDPRIVDHLFGDRGQRGMEKQAMDSARRAKGLRETFRGAINLALVPVRLPQVLFRFIADEWTRYEQRQAWRRHVVGTDLEPPPDGGSWLPNGRDYH